MTIQMIIDRGAFKSDNNNREIQTYTLNVTKFKWNKHPAPDYKMLNSQYILDSLEKMDIIQTCVLWELKFEGQFS